MARGKPRKDKDVDLGLAILAAVSEPPHTLETIAAFCGVSRQAIEHIERRALRKVRAYFYRQKIQKLADLVDL